MKSMIVSERRYSTVSNQVPKRYAMQICIDNDYMHALVYDVHAIYAEYRTLLINQSGKGQCVCV